MGKGLSFTWTWKLRIQSIFQTTAITFSRHFFGGHVAYLLVRVLFTSRHAAFTCSLPLPNPRLDMWITSTNLNSASANRIATLCQASLRVKRCFFFLYLTVFLFSFSFWLKATNILRKFNTSIFTSNSRVIWQNVALGIINIVTWSTSRAIDKTNI